MRMNDMTNAELFKKVFGFTPYASECPAPPKICKDYTTTNGKCKGCPFDNWWNKYYLPGFEIKDEWDGDDE